MVEKVTKAKTGKRVLRERETCRVQAGKLSKG